MNLNVNIPVIITTAIGYSALIGAFTYIMTKDRFFIFSTAVCLQLFINCLNHDLYILIGTSVVLLSIGVRQVIKLTTYRNLSIIGIVTALTIFSTIFDSISDILLSQLIGIAIILCFWFIGLTKYKELKRLRESASISAFDTTNKIVKMMRVTELRLEKEVKQRTLELTDALELLTEKNQELLRVNEEKVQLFELVIHDIKSPLSTVMLLLTDVIERPSGRKEDKIIDSLTIIDRINLIINRILNTRALEAGHFLPRIEMHSTEDLVFGLYREYLPVAKKKQILINLERKILTCYTDRGAAYQILDNLISNAIKFSQKNSAVRISFDEDESYISIKVSDTGPGISEKDKLKLFSKFQTLSNKPTGGESSSGVGLFMSLYLTNLLGGCLSHHDNSPQGSVFVLELPKHPKKQTA